MTWKKITLVLILLAIIASIAFAECAGEAAQCDEADFVSPCEDLAQQGCVLKFDNCYGTSVIHCNTIQNEQDCENQYDCYWNPLDPDTEADCHGTALPCVWLRISARRKYCEDQMTISGTCTEIYECDGPEINCSDLSIESECNAWNGCTWQEETPPEPSPSPSPSESPSPTPSTTPTITPTQTQTPTSTQTPTQSCSSGWKCKTATKKGYQDMYCVWSSLEDCENGCKNGECIQTTEVIAEPGTQPTQEPTQQQADSTSQILVESLDCGDLENGQCSESKPLICKQRKLAEDCITCGCPEEQQCSLISQKCFDPETQTALDPTPFIPFFGAIIFVIIALFGLNFLKNHFKEKNILTENQRFEIAKRKRMLKDLKVAYYKRQITETEFKDSSIKIQAELKEITKANLNKKT